MAQPATGSKPTDLFTALISNPSYLGPPGITRWSPDFATYVQQYVDVKAPALGAQLRSQGMSQPSSFAQRAQGGPLSAWNQPVAEPAMTQPGQQPVAAAPPQEPAAPASPASSGSSGMGDLANRYLRGPQQSKPMTAAAQPRQPNTVLAGSNQRAAPEKNYGAFRSLLPSQRSAGTPASATNPGA